MVDGGGGVYIYVVHQAILLSSPPVLSVLSLPLSLGWGLHRLATSSESPLKKLVRLCRHFILIDLILGTIHNFPSDFYIENLLGTDMTNGKLPNFALRKCGAPLFLIFPSCNLEEGGEGEGEGKGISDGMS